MKLSILIQWNFQNH